MNDVYEQEIQDAKEINRFIVAQISNIPTIVLNDMVAAHAYQSLMICSPLARRINSESTELLIVEAERRNLIN